MKYLVGACDVAKSGHLQMCEITTPDLKINNRCLYTVTLALIDRLSFTVIFCLHSGWSLKASSTVHACETEEMQKAMEA